MASNQSKAPVLIGIAIAVFTMGTASFLALSGGADSATTENGPRAAATAQVTVPEVGEARPVAAEPPPPRSPASATPLAPSVQRNRMTRDVKREQIWSALGREHELEPAAPGSAAPTQTTAAALPPLDPQYIRTAITEQLIPVAKECYDSVLADDPSLAGTLVTDFTIVGAEDVGGIVEVAAVRSDESTLDNEFVRECVRESLMAVTFDAPPDGGRVEVTNSFEFRPDE